MIQDSGKHTSRFSLLSFETTSNGTEDLISSIGYQDVGPRQEYPARVIPKRYSFNDGRQLAEFQLVYITGGTGVFEDNESSRIVTPGTLFLLRPGYWHSYHPNRDTGWTEYYIGFNGPTFRREIERFFGERKGPIELGMSAPPRGPFRTGSLLFGTPMLSDDVDSAGCRDPHACIGELQSHHTGQD